MEFQVPQFIEREIRIAGPLTFKQFLFLAAAGLIVIFFYLVLAAKSFLLFLLFATISAVTSLLLAFGNVGGISLVTVIGNFFTYTFSSKVYFWQKKAVTPKLIEISKPPISKEVPTAELKGKSRLGDLSSQLEMGRQ